MLESQPEAGTGHPEELVLAGIPRDHIQGKGSVSSKDGVQEPQENLKPQHTKHFSIRFRKRKETPGPKGAAALGESPGGVGDTDDPSVGDAHNCSVLFPVSVYGLSLYPGRDVYGPGLEGSGLSQERTQEQLSFTGDHGEVPMLSIEWGDISLLEWAHWHFPGYTHSQKLSTTRRGRKKKKLQGERAQLMLEKD